MISDLVPDLPPAEPEWTTWQVLGFIAAAFALGVMGGFVYSKEICNVLGRVLG